MIAALVAHATLSLFVVGDSTAHHQQIHMEPALEACLHADVTYHAQNGVESTEIDVPANTTEDVLVQLGTNDIIGGHSEPREIHKRIWRILSQVQDGRVYWQTPYVGFDNAGTAEWYRALLMWERIGMLTIVPWIGQAAEDATTYNQFGENADGVHFDPDGAAVMVWIQCQTLSRS